ncbi:MAG: hypothetical protein HZY74_09560 [Brevundimonas sp.]|nr:MAG: hypothetical protein HZY74_09560 [Brevundimonas sp.]
MKDFGFSAVVVDATMEAPLGHGFPDQAFSGLLGQRWCADGQTGTEAQQDQKFTSHG